MDNDTRQLMDRIKAEAGDCDCLGCCDLRRWADLIEERQPASFESVPEANCRLEENCDCRGCRFSRRMLFMGADADGSNGN